MRQGALPMTTMMAASAAPGMTTKKTLDLNVVYADSSIYNPATGRANKVRLRSYAGYWRRSRRPLCRADDPGDRFDITLHNKLPPDPSCIGMNIIPDIPTAFNGTNMHSHGLWVSPTGNSDRVLLSINPSVNFQYEYNISPDHPAGTFWYHSHRHGSTGLQVSSGMAGALVIRGDRLPTPTEHGDIDKLLKTRNGAPLTERIPVLQQIQYACLDAAANIKAKKDEKVNVIAWISDPGDVGGIEFYAANGNGFGPGSWNEAGRYTSINGLVLSTFRAKAGVIERWRLIHGGVRDTIALQFYKLKPDAPAIDRCPPPPKMAAPAIPCPFR